MPFLLDHKVLDKTVVGTSGDTVSNPIFLAYLKQDKLLASWLLSTIAPEVLHYLTGLTTSQSIWNALARRYGARSSSRLSALRHTLHSQKKRNLLVSEYLSKIKNICDTLNASGNVVTEQEQISVILAGLTAEFESVITFASREGQSLESVSEMLLDCEARQKEFLSDSFSVQANVVTRRLPPKEDEVDSKEEFVDEQYSNDQRTCFRGQRGGNFNRGRDHGRYGSNRPQCQLCGKFGHLVQKCYHRFDHNYQGQGSTNSRGGYHGQQSFGFSQRPSSNFTGSTPSPFQAYSHAFSPHAVCPSPYPTPFLPSAPFVSPVAPGYSPYFVPTQSSSALPSPAASPSYPPVGGSFNSSSDVVWFPDSGATHHITSDHGNLHTESSYTGKDSLLVGDGHAVRISHVGTGMISNGCRSLRLQNLLCVPDIRKNLLSVSQFARDNGVFFEFHSRFCVVKDALTKEPFLEGKLTPEGLYELRSTSVQQGRGSIIADGGSAQTYAVSTSSDTLDVWHRRLGHPSLSVLKAALTSCNISFQSNKLPSVCSPCLQGKAHKLPFSLSTTEYTTPF
ncbi:hypothetical protein HRI_004106900 [Hibiscus trionum]|uniref:GAG-pre-integrase domain-containing protein n=1 Tax=Hibiscus trionum TaxID=183268 RepID=A0A9W7MKZ6_HIBTR|nr:hypothetical protein HRI_004106900 [Hibiscus trionum]